jgi:putative secretion ATPase (PEP-CTERM system associated)
MYTDFYKLSGLPFQLTPDARFFFGSSGHNKAMAHLTYGLGQGEGFIIITGEIGAGKTTIVDHLLDQLDSRKYVAAKISNTQLGADDTLRMVASAFGIPQEGADKATLLRRFEQFLARAMQDGRRAVLVIDECQNLSVAAIEELRMLSNIQIQGRPPLQSFLLGQPQFRDTLASDDLDQLRQRVIASYHLGPLDPTETRYYVEHRLRMVGWQNDPRLSDDFFEPVYRHTGGVPRRINTLCSRVLLYGFLEDRHELNAADVEEVARDLEKEVSRVAAPRTSQPRPAPAVASAPPIAVAAGNDEVLSRIAVMESQLRSNERLLREVLRIAADFFNERER